MAKLTTEEMISKLKTLGLKRKYKPVNDFANSERDSGQEVIMLEVRKPASFVDGYMSGSEIDISDNKTVRIWTSRKNKAAAVARDNNFPVRFFDGEAELYVPLERADEFLHSFGAKVKSKRNFTPEQIEAIKMRLSKFRLARREKKTREIAQPVAP